MGAPCAMFTPKHQVVCQYQWQLTIVRRNHRVIDGVFVLDMINYSHFFDTLKLNLTR